MYGNNNQPSDNGARLKVTRRMLEDRLHAAQKHEQRVWGSGEHQKARDEVLRLQKQTEDNVS